MTIETTSPAQLYRLPQSRLPNGLFKDVAGTKKADGVTNPLATSYFYIENVGTEFGPTHPYTHEESGIVLKGILVLVDETGARVTLEEGASFFIHRGSVITFETPTFALMFKCASRFSIGAEDIPRVLAV